MAWPASRGRYRDRHGRSLGLLAAAQVVGFSQRARSDIVHLVDQARHFGERRGRGGRQATCAGDELEAAGARPHQQRLQDAVLLNRLHERRKIARLGRPGNVDVADGNQPHLRGDRSRRQLIHVVRVVPHAKPGRQALTRERGRGEVVSRQNASGRAGGT